jgi:hypothetical protein
MKYLTLLSLGVPLVCAADDFKTADFGLRFPTTLSHFSPYGDVAAEAGSGVASIWGSSPNPASLSWGLQGNPNNHDMAYDVNGIASVQYSNLDFDQGQEIRFLSEAVVLELDDRNVIRLAFGTGDSNQEIIRTFPVTFDFELKGGRIDWGHKLSETLRVGLGGTYSVSDIRFTAPGFDAVDTDRETWALRAGLVKSTEDKRWLFGLMADYGQGRNDTVEQLPTPTGQLVRTVEKETIDQFYVRPGIAYALDKHHLSWAHLDYEFSHFASDEESLDNHRVLLGADYFVKYFHVRAGVFADGRGNTGWSTGVAIHIPKDWLKFGSAHFDIAYQANAFPEVAQEFGDAQTLNFSVAIQW